MKYKVGTARKLAAFGILLLVVLILVLAYYFSSTIELAPGSEGLSFLQQGQDVHMKGVFT